MAATIRPVFEYHQLGINSSVSCPGEMPHGGPNLYMLLQTSTLEDPVNHFRRFQKVMRARHSNGGLGILLVADVQEYVQVFALTGTFGSKDVRFWVGLLTKGSRMHHRPDLLTSI